MKRNFKRTLAVLLSVIMLLSLMPMGSFAVDIVDRGQCGDNVYWTLDNNGTLTISGEGTMKDYSEKESPFYQNKLIKSVIIENGVTSIGNYIFQYCDFTSVTIPDSVTSIGDYAFYSCDFTSVVIPDSVTNIGDYAFAHSDLVSITIPDSVTSLGAGVFWNCLRLVSATIPKSITSIDGLFSACHELKSIIIPDSVTTIGSSAFWLCENLISITIPSRVTSIGLYAFAECYNLTSMIIPNSVTSIGEAAFRSCYSLKDVYYTGSEEQWKQIKRGSNNEYLINATIHYNYVPDDNNVDDDQNSGEKFPDGYDFFKDSYSFTNSFDIPITNQKYFNAIFNPGHSKTMAEFYEEKKDISDGGVCFGMAYTTGALLRGIPLVNTIASSKFSANIGQFHSSIRELSPSSVFGIIGSDGNNMVLSVLDYILYSHVYQLSTENRNNLVLIDFGDNFSSSDLESLFNDISTLIKNNIVPSISMKRTYIDSAGNIQGDGGHRVLAVGIEGHDILLDDPNNKDDFNRIHINDDFTEWSYSEPWTTDHNSTTDNTNTYLGYSYKDFSEPYHILRTGTKVNYEDDSETDTVGNTQRLDGDKLLVYINCETCSIVNEDAMEIDIANGTSTGATNSRLYWIENDKTVTVTGIQGDNNKVSVSGCNDVLQIETSGASDQISLTMDEDDNVINAQINSVPGQEYSIELISANDNPADNTAITVTGTAFGELITSEQTLDGMIVSGLNDITITYIEDEEIVAESTAEVTDGRTVNITVDEDNNTVSTDFDDETSQEQDNTCKYCGKVHGTSLWGKFIQFVHNIFYFIKNLFK